MPGLVVVAPATPADNYGLLKSSMASGDPVIYMEHKELWGLQGEVDTANEVPIGKGKKLAQGNDLTIVTWSRGVGVCQQALADGAFDKLKPDLIDLRSIWPWDKEMVFESAARTGRLLVVHEAIQVAGFGAEVAAATAEKRRKRHQQPERPDSQDPPHCQSKQRRGEQSRSGKSDLC